LQQTSFKAGKVPHISTCMLALRSSQPDNTFGRCRQPCPQAFSLCSYDDAENRAGEWT